jgi:hypothetical protein
LPVCVRLAGIHQRLAPSVLDPVSVRSAASGALPPQAAFTAQINPYTVRLRSLSCSVATTSTTAKQHREIPFQRRHFPYQPERESPSDIVMEAAAALVSFVGLAGPVAQGLKFFYDFATDMKDCPKDIREMKTDLELVEDLITQIIQQCNERDKQLRESTALARAIHHAQERVEDLKKELAAYLVYGKRKRLRFAKAPDKFG